MAKMQKNSLGSSLDPSIYASDDDILATGNQNIAMIAYNEADLLKAKLSFNALNENKTFLSFTKEWMKPNNWTSVEWVKHLKKTHSIFSTAIVIQYDTGSLIFKFSKYEYVFISQGGQHLINTEIMGDEQFISKISAIFDNEFDSAGSVIEWVYNSQGHSITLPVTAKPIFDSAYPWIENESVDSYLQRYIDSDASVLVLLGPPGTGKTSLIKHIVKKYGKANVTYDAAVMENDYFFAQFIDEQDTRFLIMEDADNFLAARKDGNSFMHRFLNISDGLVSAKNKKIIFTTNLPSINDVDEALLRPGRCFDTLHFRQLTHLEAVNFCKDIGRDHTTLPDGNLSLAEIFSKIANGALSEPKKKLHSFGFIGG